MTKQKLLRLLDEYFNLKEAMDLAVLKSSIYTQELSRYKQVEAELRTVIQEELE